MKSKKYFENKIPLSHPWRSLYKLHVWVSPRKYKQKHKTHVFGSQVREPFDV
jgi:hypothetical protein